MIRFLSTVTAIAFLGHMVPAQMVQNCRPGVDAGIIACPCANPPAGGGLGCDNFGGLPAQSGTLTAGGVASLAADTITLDASGENNASLTVFFTGDGALHATGLVHVAGVRCVTVGMKRLYIGTAVGGAISRPAMGNPSVSVKTAAAGAAIMAGQTRHYFNTYRDAGAAGPCGDTGATVNTTNSGSIAWGL